jgi:hypothetical protein
MDPMGYQMQMPKRIVKDVISPMRFSDVFQAWNWKCLDPARRFMSCRLPCRNPMWRYNILILSNSDSDYTNQSCNIYIYIFIHTLTYPHTHTHIYIHIHMCACKIMELVCLQLPRCITRGQITAISADVNPELVIPWAVLVGVSDEITFLGVTPARATRVN